MAIDVGIFKDVMANWASGVTVVTTVDNDMRKGITVSSFCSVSLDPPLVLICISRDLYSHEVIERAGVFAVNLLGHDQIELGKLFAGLIPEIEDRFADLDCTTAITGSPILPGVTGWMDCRVQSAYEAGDHTIFIGEVLGGKVVNEKLPLGYFQRGWGQFDRLSDT